MNVVKCMVLLLNLHNFFLLNGDIPFFLETKANKNKLNIHDTILKFSP